MSEKSKFGTLYIVATPIGNLEDITIRAIKVLANVDAVICEEIKEGSRLLHSLKIENHLITLNEHNEEEVIQNIIVELMAGKSLALVSDCGTPLFSDPGRKLLSTLVEVNFKIVPIPGSSSLMTALSVCAFPMEQFRFIGFLPPKAEHRSRILATLKHETTPLIFMDTPYRLGRLLDEVIQTFGRDQMAFLGCDLTLPNEFILHGRIDEISRKVAGQKREFILILDTPNKGKRSFGK
jgi:16S rRNA (cytidine1402-2'-O)-methyltransferase